jgi:hypothetical protein
VGAPAPLPGTSTIPMVPNAGLLVSFTAVTANTTGANGCYVEYRIWTSFTGLLPEKTYQYAPPAGPWPPISSSASRTHAFGLVPPGTHQVQVWASSPCGGIQLNEFAITGLVLKH